MPDKYPKNRRMVFTPDKNNPTKTKKTMREATSVEDFLPTRNGIYMPKPKAPAVEIPVKKPAPKRQKLGNLRKNKVQFSSPEKAKKAMQKNIKQKQRGRTPKSLFNL